MEAAKAFFQQAQAGADVSPEQVFTDGLNSYPRAIKEGLGAEVKHAVISCLAIRLSKVTRPSSNATIQPLALAPLSRPNVSVKRLMRCISSSDRVSEWRNSYLSPIDENTFYSELMRCKRYLRRLRGEKKRERCLFTTNVRFEESVLTISPIE